MNKKYFFISNRKIRKSKESKNFDFNEEYYELHESNVLKYETRREQEKIYSVGSIEYVQTVPGIQIRINLELVYNDDLHKVLLDNKKLIKFQDYKFIVTDSQVNFERELFSIEGILI